MTDDTINYARHFPTDDEPRNAKGETLPEYMDKVKAVHASLKDSLFHHMALKRKARGVHEMRQHDSRVRSISGKLANCRAIAAFYGINLK
jgi:hypothetical protein